MVTLVNRIAYQETRSDLCIRACTFPSTTRLPKGDERPLNPFLHTQAGEGGARDSVRGRGKKGQGYSHLLGPDALRLRPVLTNRRIPRRESWP